MSLPCKDPGMGLQVGVTLRYPRDRRPDAEVIDDVSNFFFLTHTPDGLGQAQLEKGINRMRDVESPDGPRCPAVLISSSRHKMGSAVTPWHDSYDMEGGRVRYFGDAKFEHMPDPHGVEGNKVMMGLFEQHHSPSREVRAHAPPLVFFERPEKKGYVTFRGFGVIENAELVTQVDSDGMAFSNYVYDCALLKLAEEGECLDWAWISRRKDPSVTDSQTLKLAPKAWRDWIQGGAGALPTVRRVVARQGIVGKENQIPEKGSGEEEILREIYEFYLRGGMKTKTRFEALAERVAEEVISESHSRYLPGWVTRGSGDHGIDFVGRIDIGSSGFSRTALIVLGQAKCVKPGTGTSGEDVARTVARLRRGWVGCFVTTGYFTRGCQQDVFEDRYPLIMIPGRKVAEAVKGICVSTASTTRDFLEAVDATYEDRLKVRTPEQVLYL